MLRQLLSGDPQSTKPLTRYGIAVVSVLLVLVFRALLHPILGDSSRYIVFLLAVLFTARYGGARPALLALILGVFAGNIFFFHPYFELKIGDLNDLLGMVFYALVGFAIIYLFAIVHRREKLLAAQITHQHEIENALRMSEERFRLATEALQGAIYDWDASKNVAYRSPVIFDLVGYKGDEVQDTRQWWQNLIHPDDFERVQRLIQKSIDEHASIHSVEYRVRHKDGHYIWVWDKSRIIYDANGKLVRLIGCTLSIDERITLAESLAQTQERFRVAFENASDAMVMSDASGVVLAANDAYCQLYGYTPEEVVGQDFAIIFPEANRPEAKANYQRAFHNEADSEPSFESVVQRKDGTNRIVESRVGFVSAQGQRKYMLSVVRDLTERKQAEADLYTRFRLTADLAQAGSIEDVAKITVDNLMQQIGADFGTIYLYHAADNTFELLYANMAWLASGALNGWQRFPANPDYPMTKVVKHNQSLWFPDIQAYESAFPVVKQFAHLNQGATILLPLVAASEVIGEMSLLFSKPRAFTQTEQTFIISLVYQCAQAIERARLAEKAQQLAVVEERQRLARDLHDNVSQLLFSSSVVSEMLPRLMTTKPDKAVQQAEELNWMVRGAMAEMRTLLWELRPESIIQTKLSNLLTQLAYSVETRQEVKVTLHLPNDSEVMLPPDPQVAFYRIAQEALHNIFKHGHATAIAVRLRQTTTYTALVIADNGQGFDASADSAGFGLRNMQERAANIGARFSLKSRPASGTRIRLLWSSPS